MLQFTDIFTGGWTRFIAKRISDRVISGKIGEVVEQVREKIKEWYIDYRWNIIITVILNFLIVAIAFVSHFFFTINIVIVCIISSLSIFMIIRTLIRFIKLIIYTVIPNWGNIVRYGRIFFLDISSGYGISGSIRDTIHVAFTYIYDDNTSGLSRFAHKIFSKLRFVKSQEEISEEVQDEFYALITGYTVRLIIYKIIAFFIYLIVFTFVLKPLIFTNILKLNALQIIVYPFTVALPAIIKIIKQIIY